ncbi:MAG: lysophospholipid acyltransferase family protein [Gammaproteobacteria bacterium]|nr:MAG: lysophospholipid acyltransferase family protein [Gammaproteobacteria bacterium]
MFSVEEIVSQHLPELSKKYPFLDKSPKLVKSINTVLRYLLHENEFVEFAKEYPTLKGVDFVEKVLEYFNFTYRISDADKEKIPDAGRVVIISNHPIGSLDGLALLQLVARIRPDVKIMANQLLSKIEPLNNLLFPVDNMGANTVRAQFESIFKHLDDEGAVIIFPAGEVSRMTFTGVKDQTWNSGFLRIANRSRAPIVPLHIKARNSLAFYGTSFFFKTLSTVMLVGEMFKHEANNITITVGSPIPHSSYGDSKLTSKAQIKLFKKHLYRLPKGKDDLFKTEAAISHAENRQYLKKEIEECEKLGVTSDGKDIYLYKHTDSSSIMREIGRLREISFRAVGEGSGSKRDIDIYDSTYYHLILWDKEDLEIVGSYRFGDASEINAKQGLEGLYTNTLFNYDDSMLPFIERGLELGRSFVQPKYWGRRSLDYLWFGIGAFLAKNPKYRYLYGPVSISATFPSIAKDMLVWYYSHYYPHHEQSATAKRPYLLSKEGQEQIEEIFCKDDPKEDFKRLKNMLDNIGVAVPTLYKQYSDLCNDDGVKFLAFSVDPDFNNCLDGLVMVDMDRLKATKKKRYIDAHLAED